MKICIFHLISENSESRIYELSHHPPMPESFSRSQIAWPEHVIVSPSSLQSISQSGPAHPSFPCPAGTPLVQVAPVLHVSLFSLKTLTLPTQSSPLPFLFLTLADWVYVFNSQYLILELRKVGEKYLSFVTIIIYFLSFYQIFFWCQAAKCKQRYKNYK